MCDLFDEQIFETKLRRLANSFQKRYGDLLKYDVEEEITKYKVSHNGVGIYGTKTDNVKDSAREACSLRRRPDPAPRIGKGEERQNPRRGCERADAGHRLRHIPLRHIIKHWSWRCHHRSQLGMAVTEGGHWRGQGIHYPCRIVSCIAPKDKFRG